MALMLPGHLTEALQYLGYEWPSSNEDILFANAGEFRTAADTARAFVDEVDQAINHIIGSNDSLASDAFVSYMRSDDSNRSSLSDFAEASEIIAGGFDVIGGAVIVLKGVVIAQLIILAAAIASAIISLGIGAGAAVAAREAAKRLIDVAINIAIEKVMFA